MPVLGPNDDLGLAFDIAGCPNRCRHCWLDHRVVTTPRSRMTEDDLRWAVAQFRAFRRPGETRAPWKRLRVEAWIREPDYADNYRALHALATELSDLPPQRDKMELLSVWRLTRDPEYAAWGYELGVREAQLAFFGLETATDWVVRRKGQFQDLLTASERLLAAGIRPRWQLFFTKLLIPDLPGLIALAEELHLKERCEALGAPFAFWMHSPTPDGAGLTLEHLRPTDRDLNRVPRAFLEHSEAHMKGPIGLTERTLMRALRHETGPAFASLPEVTTGHPLWLYVASNLDVYPSFTAIWPAFRLGNLRKDGVAKVIDTLEHDRTPGLQAMFHTPTAELAAAYGRPYGRRLYDTGDLKWKWVALRAREVGLCT